MKKYLLFIAFGLIVNLSAFAQNKSLNQFSFLLGNWEMKTKNGKITEHWVKHTDSLTGTSYKHNLKGDSILQEAVVIKKIGKDLYYCVTGFEKNNLGKTNFKLISTDDKIYVFENAEHDFPQRVVYQDKGKKKELFAWIEGKIKEEKHKIEFSYKRE